MPICTQQLQLESCSAAKSITPWRLCSSGLGKTGHWHHIFKVTSKGLNVDTMQGEQVQMLKKKTVFSFKKSRASVFFGFERHRLFIFWQREVGEGYGGKEAVGGKNVGSSGSKNNRDSFWTS